MELSIIIVSWNVSGLLAKCLDTIRDSGVQTVAPDGTTYGNGPLTEVIVVDSDSHDDSVAMLQTHYPWVHLVVETENVGFVRGNNIGLAHATGRHLLLLNPDTEVRGGALNRLMEVLLNDDAIGIVGPHTLNTDGTHQSSRRRFPTIWTAIFESTWLEPLAPSAILQQYRVEDRPDDGVYEVGWVQGSALMAKRDVYEQIGGLDARYIMYSEELDWCKRAALAGWKTVYVGDAFVVHHGGQSSTQVKARSHVHFQHSKLRYFRRFHGVGAAVLIWMVLVLNYAWQLTLESAKWLVGHKRPLRSERIKAYWLVLRSFFGGERVASRKA